MTQRFLKVSGATDRSVLMLRLCRVADGHLREPLVRRGFSAIPISSVGRLTMRRGIGAGILLIAVGLLAAAGTLAAYAAVCVASSPW
jgi:hypothetical protein